MPKTTLQNNAIKEQRAKEILEASLRLFCEKGFDRVSINMIADECNISHGLLYHYYQSKEEILTNLNRTYLKELEINLIKLYKPGEKAEDYFKKALDYVLSYIQSSKTNTYYSNLFFQTTLNELNKNSAYMPLSPKLHSIIYNAMKSIKKSSTNVTAKDFDNLIIYALLLLEAYSGAQYKYPRLVRDEPKVDDILNFIKYGTQGSGHFDN